MTDLVPVVIERPALIDRPTTAGGWTDLLRLAAEWAALVCDTEFVPASMRRKPESVAAAILFGAELGIGPMQSLAKIDVVQGRPAPRAELARALALGAGHDLWVDESTNTRVRVCGRRRGSTHVQTVEWTMDDVRRAGLATGNYQKYPRQMLLARASAELVRMMCPEVLGGIGVVAEEIDSPDVHVSTAVVPAGPRTALDEPETPAKRTARRRHPAAGNATPEPYVAPVAPEPEAAPVAQVIDAQTEAQVRKLMALMNEAGLTDRDDRLHFAQAVVGRALTTSKELTRAETARVIDAAEGLADGRVGIVVGQDGAWTVRAETDELTVPGDDDYDGDAS